MQNQEITSIVKDPYSKVESNYLNSVYILAPKLEIGSFLGKFSSCNFTSVLSIEQNHFPFQLLDPFRF